jgi:hypothetical protein
MRFFFHAEDGQVIPDKTGTDLPGTEAARVEAVKIAAQLLERSPEEFWKDRTLRVICADDGGLTLFSIEVLAVVAAASPPVSPRS